LEILREDPETMTEIHQNMGKALDEMRIRDPNFKMKELNIVNNPLFERRMKKTKAGEVLAESSKTSAASTSSADMPPPSTAIAFSQPMIVEEYSREQSMITPTNSRQSSPNRNH
jgi:hypothetical protein